LPTKGVSFILGNSLDLQSVDDTQDPQLNILKQNISLQLLEVI